MMTYMTLQTVVSTVVVGLFGLIAGSFLNVVIYRIPRKESIVFPPSHCPQCQEPIKALDNIPVLSFALLGGKCRHCASPISWQYPLIELAASLLGIGLFILYGPTVGFVSDYSLALILLAAAVIDARYMIIPDRLNLSGGLIAAAFSLVYGLPGIARAAAGAVTGAVVLMGMYALGKILFKKDGVGFGDVKLAFVTGLFIGPFWCLSALTAAICLGGMWGVVHVVMGRKKFGIEVPFGPFIAAGGFLVLFFRAQILYLVEQYLMML